MRSMLLGQLKPNSWDIHTYLCTPPPRLGCVHLARVARRTNCPRGPTTVSHQELECLSQAKVRPAIKRCRVDWCGLTGVNKARGRQTT